MQMNGDLKVKQGYSQFYKHPQIRFVDKKTYKNEPNLHQISSRQKYNMRNMPQAVELIKECFSKIQNQLINEFCLTVFPVKMNKQSHQNLYHALTSLYDIKRRVGQQYPEIREFIIKKGDQFNPSVRQALINLYRKEQFSKYLEADVNFQTQTNSPEVIQINQNSKEKQVSNTQDSKKITSKKSNKSQKSNSLRPEPKKYANTIGSEIDLVKNIDGRGICVCDKEVSALNSFLCSNCNYPYHLQCMKRKQKIKHCSMCHLKLLLPNKQTKKTLFMGFLRKGRKKHEFSIFLKEEDLTPKSKLQVRCFRIKQTTQNFVLFPDHTEVYVNNVNVKQFSPLHRQSSLKYRKDEPFYIQLKNLLPKQNKITIVQKLPSKQLKDVRIQSENHVIGFFMIEQKKIDSLIKQITLSSMSSFEQSKKLLQSNYIASGGQDSVSCEVVKIPLTCTLSTEKIKIPARGIFCNHYPCFDLQNFLMMISQSANPRWVCPLCKLPCYMFTIDCILLAILEKFAQHPLTEVMLFKSGDFTVNAGENQVTEKTMNISELPIQSLAKRAASQLPEPEKKKKKPVLNIQPQKVISIDLD